MAGLTSIADRLTPSTPIELTFGAQLVAVGRKFTTLFAHKGAGAPIVDYGVYQVINVGDPIAVKTEVEAQFGVGSEASLMAIAFVSENVFAGRSNYPAFRIVALPVGVTTFGPAKEAFAAVQHMRSDVLVSPYPLSSVVNADLDTFAIQLSGPDRDLQGQFGTSWVAGCIDAISGLAGLNTVNSRNAVLAYLQDTNTAAVVDNVDTTSGSPLLTNISSTVGIYQGAVITAAGVPVGTTVQQVFSDHIQMSANATASHVAESASFQNVISQPESIIAACHASMLMSLPFPYNPVQGMVSGYLIPPRKPSDVIVIDPNGASEAILAAGLSPLYVQPGNKVGYIRSRTAKVLNGAVPVTAYFDWQDLSVMYDFREVCFQVTQNPPFNNNPGGTKASKTIAALLKDEILKEAMSFQDQGAFQGVKTLAPLFLVQPSTSSRGRFDFKIPVNVIPGLYVIAGNIQGVSDIGNFSL